jgi:adenylate kinase family enzyme
MSSVSRPRIHVVGASGAGTTTLGRALADRLGCRHLAALPCPVVRLETARPAGAQLERLAAHPACR